MQPARPVPRREHNRMYRPIKRRRMGKLPILLGLMLLLLALQAWAGGPRFVTGMRYASKGQMMAFYTSQPTYYTDPGALASTVSHAQADAMVAAAAAVWNVTIANLTLSQGGALAEHVSGANSYFDGSGIVFPADVRAANYLSVPIAVIYDTDGSVTDLLLGSGASSPSGCRQNGVTQSVDAFGAAGTIEHAVIVLNGRCVGTNAQQLTQMQYQLMRAFGRVLGLAWSQLNDNIFTGTPQPTAAQMAYWPVMHPLDVICGPYTYQCMTNAFTLRPDDLSALALLYPVTAANQMPGKLISTTNGVNVEGWTSFADGQGMGLLNMTVTRSSSDGGGWESWQVASGITGAAFQQNGGNPVSGPEPAEDDVGVPYVDKQANYNIGYVPVFPPYTGLWIRPEAINPLYTGEYAIGPYQRTPMSMATAPPTTISPFAQAGVQQAFWITMNNEPAGCNPENDGTEASPAAADPSGWWSGLLCGLGHSSWWSMAVKAKHSWTLETTALDENGLATVQKAQPVLGVWNASDATETLPTVASQPVAMNTMALGVTQLQVPASAVDGSYRMVVADQFGDGRPDFAYGVRLLYADSVAPAIVSTAGGQITITGVGFRQGNEVLVNGVLATVASWTPTQIVATAPSQKAGATNVPVDVEVLDASTGAVTDMAGALTYSASAVVVGPPAQITVLRGAGQSIAVGSSLSPVGLLVSDGSGNAVAGAAVSIYQTAYAWEGACPALGPCASAPVLQSAKMTATTDANGRVSVTALQVAGVPQVVEIAVTAGTTGFLSMSLSVVP
jgi:hypothetical protein